jgi:hypothetical protein
MVEVAVLGGFAVMSMIATYVVASKPAMEPVRTRKP